MLDHRPGARPEDVILAREGDWRELLLKGVDAVTPPSWEPRRGLGVRIVPYADLLRSNRPVEHGLTEDEDEDLDRELACLSDWTAGLLLDMASAVPGGSPPPAQSLRDRRRDLTRAVKVLAADYGVGPMNMSEYAHRYLRDIEAYLAPRNQQYRDQVRKRARDKILAAAGTGRPVDLVIGHDLGAVIAYETLAVSLPPGTPQPVLVTLGAPLGLPRVFEQLKPRPVDGRALWPPGACRWIDVHAAQDRLTGARPLSYRFECADHWFTDEPVNLGRRHPHEADAYLASAPVAKLIRILIDSDIPIPASAPEERGAPAEPPVKPMDPGPPMTREERSRLLNELRDLPLNVTEIYYVMDDIGLPPGPRPQQMNSREEAWRYVLGQLDSGAVKGGFRALIREIVARYPDHKYLSTLG
jgi:hypothetical protein